MKVECVGWLCSSLCCSDRCYVLSRISGGVVVVSDRSLLCMSSSMVS